MTVTKLSALALAASIPHRAAAKRGSPASALTCTSFKGRSLIKPTVSVMTHGRPLGSTSRRAVGSKVANSWSCA
jgi:hypothetical protein